MECKILIGQKIICDHLKIGKAIFYQLVDEGAPIIKTESGWKAHVDLLDEYYRKTITTMACKKTD